MATKHLIGLLLGTEEDWPRAFEHLLSRVGPIEHGGEHARAHVRADHERAVRPPLPPRYSLVIDRLGWWYTVPREWLKKVSLMDDVYLLNNPFTFQAMEKHSAYCAMMRLGLKVPETWLIPHKSPPENERFQPTAERTTCRSTWRRSPGEIGYPLYMKPFDGGQWVGVTRIRDATELHAVYDTSGERLMHLQASVEDFDVFARSLSIGAETMVMHFEPDRPMHDRYEVDHDFLSPETGDEVVTISRLVNAFFRWEFNSCETIVKDGVAYPIDYANASPDVALTSLHYYFPWAIRALVRWSAFCSATGRQMRINQTTRDYFEIGDREDLSYEEKLAEYRKLADAYFQIDEYEEFCAEKLPHLDEALVEWVEGPRLRPPAGRHGAVDVPGARARAVRRPLPRPAGGVGKRPAHEPATGARRAARPRAPRRAATSNGVSSKGSSCRSRSSRAIVGLRSPSTSGRATDALTGVTSSSHSAESAGVSTGTSTMRGRLPSNAAMRSIICL